MDNEVATKVFDKLVDQPNLTKPVTPANNDNQPTTVKKTLFPQLGNTLQEREQQYEKNRIEQEKQDRQKRSSEQAQANLRHFHNEAIHSRMTGPQPTQPQIETSTKY